MLGKKNKCHRLWIGEFLGTRQDYKNKSFRELAVFQASLDLIIPQICSAECTLVSWDWHTIEQATYKLLEAQTEFMKQLPVLSDSCDNTSYCISHRMKQMEQLLAWECLFCKSGGLIYSPFKTQTARKTNLRRAVFVFYYLDVTAIVNKVLMKCPHLEKKLGKWKHVPTLTEI